MDPYRTTGLLDEAAYREISRFVISPKRIWLVRIYAIVLGVLGILMLLLKQYVFAGLFLVFAPLFALTPMLMRRNYLRGTMKFMRESYPEGFARIESFFTVEGLSLRNISSGAQAVLPYGVIRMAAETKRSFLLKTEANQFALIYKECLTPGQIDSFLPFLEEQCPKLKIKRSRR